MDVMQKLLVITIRLLAFVRLLDENGDLSITNIFAMLMIYKVWSKDNLDINEIVAILSVISAYQFKRYTQRKERNT